MPILTPMTSTTFMQLVDHIPSQRPHQAIWTRSRATPTACILTVHMFPNLWSTVRTTTQGLSKLKKIVKWKSELIVNKDGQNKTLISKDPRKIKSTTARCNHIEISNSLVDMMRFHKIRILESKYTHKATICSILCTPQELR